jgi:hypothetical protein
MKLNHMANRAVRHGLTGLLALMSATAVAQPTCIPFGNGGAYAPGPPKWFDASGTGFARFNTWVDDPRWLGATATDFGQGATNELQFRALFNPQTGANRFVYLSWWYKAALNPTPINNRLYVGLRASGSTSGLLLRLVMPTLSPTTAGVPALTVHPVNADGTFGAALSTNPAWTNDVRVWIDDFTDQRTHVPPQATNPTEPDNWAVHVRLPMGVALGGGVTLNSPFHMWYELLQGTPTTPVIEYTWPRPTAAKNFAVTQPGGIEQVPPTADWPEFRLGAGGEFDTPCTGIEFLPTDIKVTHAPGATDDGKILTTSTNTFTATPTNLSGSDQPVGDVVARFRIANWGIQPNTADQADPSTGAWNTIRGLGAVQQSAPPAQISNGSKWNIAGTWLPDPAQPGEGGFFDGTRSTHQCVLVELSGPGSFSFLHNSAFRNMRIGAASTFTDSAEVSVVGLPAAPTPQRDVYLYVQTSNMPPRFVEPGRGRTTGLARVALDVAAGPGEDPGGDPAGGAAPVSVDQRSPDRVAEAQRERSEWERRMDAEPTYIVRGYFDTGRRLTIDGVSRPVLQPMVAFGYFIDHRGELRGWDHELTGAAELAPNFYRVSPPNDGKVPIGINIEAVEKPRGPARGFWLGLGGTIPHGSFANDYDPDLAGNIGYEHPIGAHTSFEATLGFHLFEPASGAPDLDVTQFGFNAKRYFSAGTLSPFIVLGVGAYSFDPGSVRFGGFLGVGLQVDIDRHFAVDGRWTLQGVVDNSPNSTYSTLLLGLRYAF